MTSATCIVGWVEKKKKEKITRVWMGGDSLVSHGYYQKSHGFKKIFLNGQFLIGVTGSVYAANLLCRVWKPPVRKIDQNDTNYLHQAGE